MRSLSEPRRNVQLPHIIQILKEDPKLATTLVEGGNDAYRRRPCSNCPWRKDAVGKFPAEAFRHSANTAYDMAQHTFACHQSTAYDMAQHTFACHQSGAERPAICAGFLLRGAIHKLAMRLKVMKGKIDLRTVSDGGVELFDSYRAMAEANGIEPNDPILIPCR
jgi:hypothetical protein